ncbi:MAG TPA: hypothetical protein VNM69_01390 [Bacillus sp. (in: firmicutes)]|nr:hypothetical protein [Bacillus sp. (in: firmicutes)]
MRSNQMSIIRQMKAKTRPAIQANVHHKIDEGQKPAGDPGECPL